MNHPTPGPISKADAAARQLDTAIDLYFTNADPLPVYTLAYASFKVLFDIYPHHRNDGFASQLDELLAREGWKKMSRPANFLKHADRDPAALLDVHAPEQGMGLIVLATLLYRRIAGDFSAKMRAFDSWLEATAQEELGIEEVDENSERAEQFRLQREAIRAMTHDQKMLLAQQHYHFFLTNFERIQALTAEEKAAGRSITELLDKHLPNGASSAD